MAIKANSVIMEFADVEKQTDTILQWFETPYHFFFQKILCVFFVPESYAEKDALSGRFATKWPFSQHAIHF